MGRDATGGDVLREGGDSSEGPSHIFVRTTCLARRTVLLETCGLKLVVCIPPNRTFATHRPSAAAVFLYLIMFGFPFWMALLCPRIPSANTAPASSRCRPARFFFPSRTPRASST